MIQSNTELLRIEALIAALNEPDPVGEGRRILLETLDERTRHAIHDEPDPMLEAIERDDEWFRRESRDYDR